MQKSISLSSSYVGKQVTITELLKKQGYTTGHFGTTFNAAGAN